MKDSIQPEKPLGNTLLRNPDTFELYMHKQETKSCMICEAPSLRDLDLWKIIRNDYPYDAVAQLHYMLVPKRHVAYWYDLSDMEKATLEIIKEDLNQEGAFDSMLENFAKSKTLPGHYHLHLMKWIRV